MEVAGGQAVNDAESWVRTDDETGGVDGSDGKLDLIHEGDDGIAYNEMREVEI